MISLALSHRGASTLDDAEGHEAVVCRDAALAAYLAEVLSLTETLARAIEDRNEFTEARAQLRLVELVRRRN